MISNTSAGGNLLQRTAADRYHAYMASKQVDILGRFLDPVARALNAGAAKALLRIQIDPVAQRRVTKLAEKANEGELTEAERSEYESYIVANDIVSIMQLRARKRIAAARR